MLQRFLARVLGWIRRQFRDPAQPSGTLELASDVATLWRIRPTEPGVCACWQICHRDASADLVISLLNIAQLREDMATQHAYRRSSDPIRLRGQRSFSDEFQSFLEAHGGIDARSVSHLFVAAWRSRILSDVGNQRRYAVRPLCSVPGDFQGLAFSPGDRYAVAVARTITRRLMRLTPGKVATWEELVSAIDWLEWLEFYAKGALGSSHVLQPRRRE